MNGRPRTRTAPAGSARLQAQVVVLAALLLTLLVALAVLHWLERAA